MVTPNRTEPNELNLSRNETLNLQMPWKPSNIYSKPSYHLYHEKVGTQRELNKQHRVPAGGPDDFLYRDGRRIWAVGDMIQV